MTNQTETITMQTTTPSTSPSAGRRLTTGAQARTRRPGLLAALIAFAFAFAATPALAAQTHVPAGSLGTSGSGAGQVSSPQGVAVDASGNVYVADQGNNRIDKFDAAGNFVLAFGKAVDQTSGGDVCTQASGHTCQAGTSGSTPGELTNVAFVAVDTSGGASDGDVYAGDPGDNLVSKFDASGNLVATWGVGGQLDGSTATDGPFGPIAGVTVDNAGSLWVYDQNGEMFAFAEDGTFSSDWNSGRGVLPGGVDADAAGNLYVLTGGGSVEQFSVTGADVGPVNGDVSNPTGFAVDRSTDEVYLDSGGAAIRHYAASCDAGGNCTADDSFGSGHLLSAAGLAIDPSTSTVYAADPGNQRIAVFTGPVTIPDATTNAATAVAPASATVNGHLDPAGGGTTADCHFDYVDDASFQGDGFTGAHTVPCAEGDAFSAAADVHADVTGLTAEATYHFRLSVTNANGTNDAADLTFATLQAAQLSTGAATSISSSKATLNGLVIPGGVPLTSCQFDYGTDTSYGTTVPCSQSLASIGSGSSNVAVSAEVSGLTAGTPYHFRLRVGNALGTTAGQDKAFVSRGTGFGFKSFAFKVLDQNGQPSTEAGGHPYELQTNVTLNTTVDHDGNVLPDGTLKDINVSLPPGLVGDPSATPTCNYGALIDDNCPPSAQIGIIQADAGGIFNPFPAAGAPIYNMERPDNLPAQFGFNISPVTGFIDSRVRTGSDYGIDSQVLNVSAAIPILATRVTLWGVPADPSHNAQRDCPGRQIHFGCGTAQLPAPLLTNPTSCTGPLTVNAQADSWQDVGHFAAATQTLPAITGCDKLSFTPSISIQPDTASADAPSGLHVDLHVPQAGLQDPNGRAASNLKKAVVTLPAGFAVNPGSADGLGACSPAQIGLSSPGPAACPDNAKVGSVEVDTPLLADQLKGSVYLAKQNDNPFDSLLAIYVTAEGDGVVIKLAGHIETDPVTGQLKTTFDNNPQQPFTDLKVDFFGGPRGALATPEACGHYAATAELTPWSGGATVTTGDSFDITTGCVSGFHPSFTAGTKNTQAGAFSPFVLSFSRSDQDEEISGLKVTLPTGLLAKVAGVPLCSDADAAAGTCPDASQVGSVTAGSGPGSKPLFLPGKAYLTGPYKGGPYGLSVVVPAKAGPFDLGNVVVRQSLSIDPIDAHVTATSDPFPTILQGIPLRVRRVDVSLDRSSFTLNPTSCAAKQIQAQMVSTNGTLADLAAPFSVGGCGDLSYAPKLAISLTGKGQTTDDKHPGVHAVLTQPVGQANNKKVIVSLPLSLALDPDNAQALCEFTDGSKTDPTCPKGSIVGQAVAHTPILDQPLTGPVYFVKNVRRDPKSGREIRTLPKLVIPLTGENGLRLNLVGTSNVVDDHLVTTFDNIPDAPVSDFTLDIDGGKSGILVVSGTDICKATQVATQQADGQNGKTADADIYLQTPACALKILSKKVGKTSVAVKVGGLSAGKVTVSGKGIKKTSKTITKSTVATITAKRTKGKPGKVTVSFDPAGPAKAHKTTK
jgi:hypothetical protein